MTRAVSARAHLGTTVVAISLCVIGALATNGCATARPAAGTATATPTPAATAAPTPATPAGTTPTPAPPAAGAAAATPATPPAPPPPRRQIATSRDGTKISYDVEGTGPALLLVHGGGQTGRSWRELGFVEKLRGQFTVITLDLRGSGESGKPTTPDAYALDRVLDDLTAVADAAKAPRFHLWGFGHGATIGRYLAARSPRVISAVLMSANFGPPLEGVVRDAVAGMRAKWLPLVQQQMAGTLKVDALSNSDRAAWDAGVAVSALALGALADYPALEPSAITVPTLWLMGAADTSAMESVKAYESKLAGTKVTLKLLNGATYSDTFGRPALSLAEAVPFLAANQ